MLSFRCQLLAYTSDIVLWVRVLLQEGANWPARSARSGEQVLLGEQVPARSCSVAVSHTFPVSQAVPMTPAALAVPLPSARPRPEAAVAMWQWPIHGGPDRLMELLCACLFILR